MKTTLKKIQDCSPSQNFWKTLLKSLGKTKADDDLALLDILESNGIEDAIWCLQVVHGYEREKRLYAVWCASQVRHLMSDKRSLNALVVSERFAEGHATEKELAAASDAQKKEFLRMLNCIANGELYEIKATGANNG